MNTQKKLEDEINFKDLLKNPLRLFGWVFPVVIVLLIALGVYYVKNISLISFNDLPVGIPDTINVKKEIPAKLGGIIPAIDLALVKTPSKEFVDKGKELYKSNCASCHGDNGMGDGTAGAMLNPKPRNFHAVDGWTNGRTIDQLYKTLQEGIIKNGMAAYEYLPTGDRMAIISYIRTFVDYPQIKDEELTALDQQYQLSKGTVVPSTIPVAQAEKKLSEEYSSLSKKLDNAAQLLKSSNENPSVQLLRKSSYNIEKVLASFVNGLNAQSVDGFSQIVCANPINYGFNPAVTQYSKENLAQIYNYLKTVTM